MAFISAKFIVFLAGLLWPGTPEKFRQPPQPALPRLFTVIIKLYAEALPCKG